MTFTITGHIINLEIPCTDYEVEKYGKEGIKILLNDVIERYGIEKYFDSDLVEEVLENKEEKL